MDNKFFRKLAPHEVEQFRQWARDNYRPGTPVDPLWHPVERAEAERINRIQRRALRALLELTASYLGHPDVQAIPFALPASAVHKKVLQAIDDLQ